jgi:hypothetical protein
MSFEDPTGVSKIIKCIEAKNSIVVARAEGRGEWGVGN